MPVRACASRLLRLPTQLTRHHGFGEHDQTGAVVGPFEKSSEDEPNSKSACIPTGNVQKEKIYSIIYIYTYMM